MDLEYSRHYRDLHDRHWWFRGRQRWLVRHLRRHLGDRKVGPILDVGAGDGLLLPTLEAFGEPEGLEPEPEAVSDATRSRFTVHLRPFDDRFEPGKTYGLITLLDVLEHLDDDVAALRHIESLLRPDGLLMLTVPALRMLWTRHDDLNHHRTRYTRSELHRVLEAAGFELLDCRYFFHWLVPVKLVVRAKEALRPGEPELPKVPAPLWNRLCYGLTCLEQDTLSRLRPPIGTSILAVVRPKRPKGPRRSPPM